MAVDLFEQEQVAVSGGDALACRGRLGAIAPADAVESDCSGHGVFRTVLRVRVSVPEYQGQRITKRASRCRTRRPVFARLSGSLQKTVGRKADVVNGGYERAWRKVRRND